MGSEYKYKGEANMSRGDPRELIGGIKYRIKGIRKRKYQEEE
jgi:hypothetical protein